ncbi:MAG: hypothetical protein IPH65_10200 [Dehalococcoidia bacterium]|uniref:hypothetical protein n=1 Tax=Candidatus Amarobacter glycogenicus TaxID=3140699 RepID=UPI003136A05E|nr:hypothetical protein [Dehalococcoidia bacterium]
MEEEAVDGPLVHIASEVLAEDDAIAGHGLRECHCRDPARGRPGDAAVDGAEDVEFAGPAANADAAAGAFLAGRKGDVVELLIGSPGGDPERTVLCDSVPEEVVSADGAVRTAILAPE